MKLVKQGIYFDDSFLGVTLGALIFPHGTILIDAPLRQEDARSWRSSLLNHLGGTNRLLVLLDAHLDRTLGARAMDSTIVSHLNTAQVFYNRPTIFKGQSVDNGSIWETHDDAIGTRWTIPNITFTQSMTLHWDGPEVILEHHSGPAQGAIWVIIPDEHVVFIGDTVTPNQPPFLSDADLPKWIEALDLLIKSYRTYEIISGRGGIITIDELRSQRRHIKKINQRLARLASRNSSPESTEKLIKALLRDFTFSNELYGQYTQRFQTGLYKYYNRHYRPSNSNDKSSTV